DLKDMMLEDSLKDLVNHLLELKIDSNEANYISRIVCLNKYIEENIDIIKNLANNLVESKFDWDELNEYFIKMLKY
ncbi:MAG: nucleotidyltransferase domain-containing protein, partial [Solobacterium sp.]|nr:nucleotidyltransferase domain-containing protein [Solobacterium sp.]